MNLIVVRIGEGARRVKVTDQTGRFAGHITGPNMVNTVIGIGNLGHVTGGAGDAAAGCDHGFDCRLNRRRVAVVTVGVTAGTVGVLSDDVGKGCQIVAVRIVANSAALLIRLRGVGQRVVADVVSMGMVVEVVAAVTGETGAAVRAEVLADR